MEMYRNELYTKCGGSAPFQRSRTKTDQQEGHSTDKSVCIEGRDTERKNASINGTYAPIPDGFEGICAYKKLGESAPRFLFYSVKKNRWKINDGLDDSKNGFAYAKTSDGGNAAPCDPSVNLQWYVFDGKEQGGYNEDSNVVCKEVGRATPAPQDVPTESPDNKPEMLAKEEDQQMTNAGGNSPSSASACSSFGAYSCLGPDIDTDDEAVSNQNQTHDNLDTDKMIVAS